MTSQSVGYSLPCEQALAAARATPITATNAQQVNAFLEQTATDEYAGTWTYLTQAMNGFALRLNPLGYFLRLDSGMAFVNIFARPTDGTHCWHVISPFALATADIAQLCQRLVGALNAPVYLKKLPHDLVGSLSAVTGFRAATDAPWHSAAPLEDDTFPEQVIRVVDALNLLETATSEIANKLRRFARRVATRRLVWRQITDEQVADARCVIRQFFEHKRTMHIELSHPLDYENMLLYPAPRGVGDLIRQVLYVDDVAMAVLVMERIGRSDAFGLYCNISLYPVVRYLSEAVVAHGLRLLSSFGAGSLNFGGSETLGLQSFKRKFGAEAATSPPGWLLFSPSAHDRIAK